MDWLDYREQLGIGFSDHEKTRHFTTNILSFLATSRSQFTNIYTENQHYKFCIITGTPMEYTHNRYVDLIEELLYNNKNKFSEFLSLLIAFINSLKTSDSENRFQKICKAIVEAYLEKAHIPVDIKYDEENNYFIFPKGAKELDDALISEPLKWLKDYPTTYRTFCIALKQYSDGIYVRDVADNLRKSLESFLQEFLGNTKNLETNKKEICKKLSELNVDSSLPSLYSTIINTYKNSNDANAKHNDKIDKQMLEFLLYQTGLLIRAVISSKTR